MSMQVGELALNELNVQCEDCCSQIFISKPNKFAAASISVANKKRKLSTRITPHLEEGNRQTEQESEKQCQFIYTAELCEEKDFENVSVPHLSVQNKTARVQQKKRKQVNKNKPNKFAAASISVAVAQLFLFIICC
jgi:hypothetical protein